MTQIRFESQPTDPDPVRALVVFANDASLPWLRILRPGFRHCYLLLERDNRWIAYNPLSHCTDIRLWPGYDAPYLAAALAREGNTVVLTKTRQAPLKCAPWRPYSCVEAVKRGLGLHEGWVLTPWQLFRHLRKTGAIVARPSENGGET